MPRQIVVRIPDALYDWLKKTAHKEEVLISELVRHMLYDQKAAMLDNYPHPNPP